jgi:hypothetical protein
MLQVTPIDRENPLSNISFSSLMRPTPPLNLGYLTHKDITINIELGLKGIVAIREVMNDDGISAENRDTCPLDPLPAQHTWKQISPICWLPLPQAEEL